MQGEIPLSSLKAPPVSAVIAVGLLLASAAAIVVVGLALLSGFDPHGRPWTGTRPAKVQPRFAANGMLSNAMISALFGAVAYDDDILRLPRAAAGQASAADKAAVGDLYLRFVNECRAIGLNPAPCESGFFRIVSTHYPAGCDHSVCGHAMKAAVAEGVGRAPPMDATRAVR